MKRCIYCDRDKSEDEFRDEHIWPDALGGDFLSSLWRSDDVCGACNSMSGVFVDGAFIKSWIGNAERSVGALDYLGSNPKNLGVLPLNYLGVLEGMPTAPGEVAEFWAGPCGANIIHLRPADSEELWKPYAGGDPRAKKSKAGRAYMALASPEQFWILVSLESFRKHFALAQRFVVNMEIPSNWNDHFTSPDLNNPVQAADMRVMNTIISATRRGESFTITPVIATDFGHRFLAKLALAIGCNLLGGDFLATDYAKSLRACFRQPDLKKRRNVPVRGAGFFNEAGLGGAEKILAWCGGWVLILNIVRDRLALSVVSPSGKSMIVYVCDEPALVGRLDAAYRDGKVWLTIPGLGEAVGPISLNAYLAHQLDELRMPKLQALADKRRNASLLPPCRHERAPETASQDSPDHG